MSDEWREILISYRVPGGALIPGEVESIEHRMVEAVHRVLCDLPETETCKADLIIGTGRWLPDEEEKQAMTELVHETEKLGLYAKEIGS